MSEVKCDATCICSLMKTYYDARGWFYFVRAGIGGDVYKTFYRRPGSKKVRGYTVLPWRHSSQEAQRDLDELATKNNWTIAASGDSEGAFNYI